MRGRIILVFASLLLSACAVTTESGTEEELLFSRTGTQAGAEKPQDTLKPHRDLPLSVTFSCPAKIFSAMTSQYIPLPPVVPVGFVNKHVSYLRVRLPENAENVAARLHLITGQGASISLPAVPQSRKTAGGVAELTYALHNDCEDFDGGVLEIASFSYQGRYYPASAARLQFASRIRTVISYWLA